MTDHRGVQQTTWDGVRAMLALSPDAVVVVATDGRIRHVNALAERLFGMTRTEIEGTAVETLVPKDLRAGHVEERAAFHADPSVRTMGSGRELSALRADGTSFRADVSLQPIEVEGDRLVLAVVRDLTPRVRLQEANRELAADAATLREFVSIASHELRTPLTSVRGFAETLLDGRIQREEQRRELLTRIVRNADRQEALLRGLLDLTRLQSGTILVEIEDVEVGELARSVVEDLDHPGIEVRVDAGTVARADPLRLAQVVLNLLTNAARYGAPPVELTATRPTADRAVITVSDRGEGVPAAFTEELFDAFSRHPSAGRRTAAGLGLGLYIAHQLVEAMGGRLDYRDTEPRGATFVVTLPTPDAVHRGPGSNGAAVGL